VGWKRKFRLVDSVGMRYANRVNSTDPSVELTEFICRQHVAVSLWCTVKYFREYLPV